MIYCIIMLDSGARTVLSTLFTLSSNGKIVKDSLEIGNIAATLQKVHFFAKSVLTPRLHWCFADKNDCDGRCVADKNDDAPSVTTEMLATHLLSRWKLTHFVPLVCRYLALLMPPCYSHRRF